MIQTLISGKLGQAIYREDGGIFVLSTGGQNRLAWASDVAETLSSSAGYEAFTVSSTSEIQSLLSVESDFENLLFLVLCAIDPRHSLTTRLECAKGSELLLENSLLKDRLETRLLSGSLPSSVRASLPKSREYFRSFDLLRASLSMLLESQERAQEIQGIWMESTAVLPADKKHEIRADFVADGTFAALVRGVDSSSNYDFNALMVGLLTRTRDSDIEHEAREVLMEMRNRILRVFFVDLPTQRRLPLQRDLKVRAALEATQFEGDSEHGPAGRYLASPLRIRPAEAKASVDQQIAAIKRELFAGRADLVERYSADLIRYQASFSEKQHLAMSLCQLSAAALEANQLDIADSLSQHALVLGVRDPVVWTSRAEVLKNLGMFGASLAAFEDAKENFPTSPYAWDGVADVLKEMGKFDESLAAYDEAKKLFPDDSVAFNGRVSTLRFAGRPREALREAVQLVERFPGDRVSRYSLAAAFAAVGRFQDAVRQYEIGFAMLGVGSGYLGGYVRSLNALGRSGTATEFIRAQLQEDPENLGLLHLLSGQLRSYGDPGEAASVAEGAISLAPGYRPAVYDLIAAQISMLVDSPLLGSIADQRVRSEQDWNGFRLVVLALIGHGSYAEAERMLRTAEQDCPWIGFRGRFGTLLGWCEHKLRRNDEAVKTLEKGLQQIDLAQQQRRYALIGAIHKEAANPVSGMFLRQFIVTKDPVVLSFRDSVLKASPRSVGDPPMSFLLAA